MNPQIRDFHSLPFYYSCPYNQFSIQCTRSSLKKKKNLVTSLFKTFQWIPRDTAGVMTMICRALSDLGPCCLSDPSLTTQSLIASSPTAEDSLLSFSLPGIPHLHLASSTGCPHCFIPSGLLTNVTD